MVSSSAATIPAVSYADRAKKAQSKPSHRPVPSQRAVPLPTSSGLSSAVIALSTSKSDSTFQPVDVALSSSIVLAHPGSSSSSPKSTSPPPSSSSVNGRVTSHHQPSSDVPKPLPSKSSSVTNVWVVRKEKMAQAQAHSRPPPRASLLLSQNPPQNQNTSATSPLSPLSIRQPDLFAGPRHTDVLQNVNHRLNTDVNGSSSLASDVSDDPFVVRLPPHLLHQQPPVVTNDVETWPQVGKSVSSNAISSNSANRSAEQPGNDHSTTQTRQNSQNQTTTSRKSEKPKWVPAQESLIAADAATTSSNASSRDSHFRTRSHTQNRGGSKLRSAHGSASGSVQGQSRIHSGRNSISQSVSRSQTQSIASSVQSSPQHSTLDSALPPEGILSGRKADIAASQAASRKVSRASSPQPIVNSVAGGSDPRMPSPYDPSFHHLQGSPSTVPAHIVHHNLALHAPHPHAFPHQPQVLYDLPQSPAYPLQDNVTTLPLPAPVQPGYSSAAPPPYPLYPSYAPYEFSQPYMYWNGPDHEQLHITNGTYPHQHIPPHFPPQNIHYPPVSSDIPSQAMPPPPADTVAPTGFHSPRANLSHNEPPHENRAENSLCSHPKEVVFGSIGLSESSKSPSPDPLPQINGATTHAQTQDSAPRPFPTFSIGVNPGEPDPSRVRIKSRRRGDTAPGRVESEDVSVITSFSDRTHTESRIVDLTDPETKWEFGTTKHLDDRNKSGEPVPESAQPPSQRPSPHLYDAPAQQDAPSIPPTLPMASADYALSRAAPLHSDDEWEVKDFGYGFGLRSGSGDAPVLAREEMQAREFERRRERERERHQVGVNAGGREYGGGGRPRRASYVEYDGGGRGWYEQSMYERGGYPNRRGRGNFSGGRGFNSRGYGRGYHHNHQPRHASVSVTPPPNFQTIVLPGDPTNVGAFPRAHQPRYAPPSNYEAYNSASPLPMSTPGAVPQIRAPVPAPLSTLSFPLDSTRYYLLGQLEYYLSPQNMAQDFFLRRHMDSRGWIYIPLIASFNRVKQVTTDLQLVKDVLALSSLVQVHSDWVRMSRWELFVLPDAVDTMVEQSDYGLSEPHPAVNGKESEDATGQSKDSHDSEGEGDEGEEEEEEEVVFVMG